MKHDYQVVALTGYCSSSVNNWTWKNNKQDGLHIVMGVTVAIWSPYCAVPSKMSLFLVPGTCPLQHKNVHNYLCFPQPGIKQSQDQSNVFAVSYYCPPPQSSVRCTRNKFLKTESIRCFQIWSTETKMKIYYDTLWSYKILPCVVWCYEVWL